MFRYFILTRRQLRTVIMVMGIHNFIVENNIESENWDILFALLGVKPTDFLHVLN